MEDIKIRFAKTSTPTSKPHYVCQTRHGNWMVGTDVPDPLDPSKTCVCGGSSVEAPFSSLEWFNQALAHPITIVENGKTTVCQSDGWTSFFPTKKLLVAALAKMGYKLGAKKCYHTWEIVAA